MFSRESRWIAGSKSTVSFAKSGSLPISSRIAATIAELRAMRGRVVDEPCQGARSTVRTVGSRVPPFPVTEHSTPIFEVPGAGNISGDNSQFVVEAGASMGGRPQPQPERELDSCSSKGAGFQPEGDRGGRVGAGASMGGATTGHSNARS